MSTFAVEVVRLDDVLPHPNADRLELAVIAGYRAVVQKDLHKKGDLVLYVPTDSVLPQNLLEMWGYKDLLAGRDRNRVKAIRLRGELSEGLVIPLEKANAALELVAGFAVDDAEEGDDLAKVLGIEKYEEPIPVEMSGRAMPRPEGFTKYTDIENIKRFPAVFREGEEIIITEKLHGINASFYLSRKAPSLFVSSHNWVLQHDPANVYWRAAHDNYVLDALNHILSMISSANTVTVHGEIIGHKIQDLAYGFKPGQIGLRWFDVKLDQEYVSTDSARMLMAWSQIPQVPILYRGPYSPTVIDEYTSGNTTINGVDHIREGIVIRPGIERIEPNIGRVILKSLNPAYLTRHGKTTERH